MPRVGRVLPSAPAPRPGWSSNAQVDRRSGEVLDDGARQQPSSRPSPAPASIAPPPSARRPDLLETARADAATRVLVVARRRRAAGARRTSSHWASRRRRARRRRVGVPRPGRRRRGAADRGRSRPAESTSSSPRPAAGRACASSAGPSRARRGRLRRGAEPRALAARGAVLPRVRGAHTCVADAGWSRRCPSCGRQHFPRTDPAVIVAITSAADPDRLLLGSNALWGANRFSCFAGFVEAGESLEAAVLREVQEEAGVDAVDIRYRGSQAWPYPRSLMLGFLATAADDAAARGGRRGDRRRALVHPRRDRRGPRRRGRAAAARHAHRSPTA